MKKLLPVILLVVVAAGLWFALSSKDPSSSGSTVASVSTSPKSGGANNPDSQGAGPADAQSGAVNNLGRDDDGEGTESYDERNAVERYKTAEEALKAIKDGAVDYDDLVLDQFTNLPANCGWCEDFYKNVKDLLTAPDTKPEQKSFYAEVLAISGRVENVKSLVELIKNSTNKDDTDLYAEALELTVGKDEVVKYLGEQLDQGSDQLRESSVAAITNQGSRLAVEMLHDHTAKRGDADGYYSVGIGLGEVVPEPEAYPYLQELVTKRDQYSHLAAKALLNSGIDGLKIVVDSMATNINADFDTEMLKTAKDHVTFDDETVQYLREIAEKSKNPAVQNFARETLAEFDQMQAEAQEETGDDSDQPFTPINPEN
jgi:hypothetical protein